MNTEDLFFELLQVAVGNRESLSRVPSAREWDEIYNMATRQALMGVCFVGLLRLQSDNISLRRAQGELGSAQTLNPDGTITPRSSTINIPEVLHLRWLGMAAKIQQKNQKLNAECAEVCKTLAYDGIRSVVIKGQSNLVYYPDELKMMRTAGDIDLWSLPYDEGVPIAVASGGSAECVNYRGVAGIVEYARLQKRIKSDADIPWHRVLYYHVEMDYEGMEVELHYRPSYLNSPLRNKRLQSWFKTNEQFGSHDAKITQEGQPPLCNFPVPSVEFNAVYQLLHIYKHLFEEGIGLRQLLDYYFVLKNLPTDMHEEIMHTLSRFGMKKFASATMYVLQTVFEAPLDPPEGREKENGDWHQRYPWMICEPNEKEGKFLLNEIMQAGNFGKYDQRIKHEGGQWSHAIEKTKHNIRLLTHYPEEVMWEPFFRLYHWIWRKFELWRW